VLKKCILTLAFVSLSQAALASPSPAATSYNLFLIPSHNVDTTVSTISNQLKQHQLSALYSQGYLPHITLYLTEYPTTNLKLLQQQAQQLAHQWHQFQVFRKKYNPKL
jgi:2'-5' RNA ligase